MRVELVKISNFFNQYLVTSQKHTNPQYCAKLIQRLRNYGMHNWYELSNNIQLTNTASSLYRIELNTFSGQSPIHSSHLNKARKHSRQKLSSCWDGPPFGHNRHGPTSRGCCAPFGGAAGSPSNTIWPASRPTSVPSGTLVYPFVYNTPMLQTYKTDRTTARSIRQTVICSGHPKLY